MQAEWDVFPVPIIQGEPSAQALHACALLHFLPVSAFAHTSTHTHTSTQKHTQAHKSTHKHTQAHTHTSTHTHKHTQAHTSTHKRALSLAVHPTVFATCRETRRHHIPIVNRTPDQPAPLVVAVVGPPQVGKTTLIRSLVKRFTRQDLKEINGPVTVVAGSFQTFFSPPWVLFVLSLVFVPLSHKRTHTHTHTHSLSLFV